MKIKKRYREFLADIPGLRFQQPRERDEPVWWLNALRLDSSLLEKRNADLVGHNLAEAVGMALMKKHPHIEIRPAFFPLHKISVFRQEARPCPNAELVYDSLLCVPSSARLERADVAEVAAALRESLREVGVLE